MFRVWKGKQRDMMGEVKGGLRKRANEYWFGEGTKRCMICCTNLREPAYHHTWIDGVNPYENEEAWRLCPLCGECHGKVESREGTPLRKLLRWIVKKKRDLFEGSLEEYMERCSGELEQNYELALGNEKQSVKKLIEKHSIKE